MADLNITLNIEEITEAVMASDMNEIMKSFTVIIFNAYMEAERDAYMEAGRYERTETRNDYRNGYYEREYVMNIGKITLTVPRTRSGEFSTEIFDRYERMDKAFVIAMAEMYVNGVSSRKVSNIVEKLCGENVSRSFVSNAVKHLDPEIYAFKTRSLTHSTFRYIYVDAMYIKVRENNRVVSKGVYIAQGVNQENKREIIGFMVGGEESEENWTNFFLDLKARGLETPKLVISDAHAGLKAAIQKVFVGSTWQRCTFHFIRNITDKMPKKGSEEARKTIGEILRASSQQEARELKVAFEESIKDNPKFDAASETLDEGFEDAIQYMLEPNEYHISLRTTNSLERINREVRRRDKVIGIYPNIEAAERLVGAVLLDIHEKLLQRKNKFLTDANPLLSK